MRFQNLLARRYIFSQKRHSILTICSIAAALTLMTMLFTGFSTILGCLRAYTYDQSPFHCLVFSVTKEQGDALTKADGIESCTLVQNKDGETYRAYIFFEKNVKEEDKVLDEAFQLAKLDFTYIDHDAADFVLNSSLMKYDFIGIAAWYEIAQLFALFYVFVIFLAMAMRLVIDTAFEISSKERERQFGVLQSIGATPRQIVGIITLEGTMLSVVGIPLGMLCGTGLAYAAFQIIVSSGITDAFFPAEKADQLMQFTVNPWMLLISAVTGYVWVWLSAYATGMRIIKMSPMQAISSRSETVKKVKKHFISGLLFGWVGKLAARNTRRAPKRFLITVVSLTISITLFASFSYVLDAVEDGYEKMHESMGFNYDFDIYYQHDDPDPFGYKESERILEESGYFDNIRIVNIEHSKYEIDENNIISFGVDYHNEESYAMLFGGNPPISYEALAEQGGYIMLQYDKETADPGAWNSLFEPVYDLTSIPLKVLSHESIASEEYETLTEEERGGIFSRENYDEQTGEVTDITYYRWNWNTVIFDVTHAYPLSKIPPAEVAKYAMSNEVILVATIAQFEQEYLNYGDIAFGNFIYCDLAKDANYREAMQFLEQTNGMELELDVYELNNTMKSSVTLLKIIIGFINAMVALIALVNMVNIISTGIMNRRSEIAAMQCVGMTQRQLYGMTVVECLQYVLASGIASSILSAALMLATTILMDSMLMLEDYESIISYTAPLPMVWFAAAVAFAAALVTSLVSLKGMQRQTLVEQIRSVD